MQIVHAIIAPLVQVPQFFQAPGFGLLSVRSISLRLSKVGGVMLALLW